MVLYHIPQFSAVPITFPVIERLRERYPSVFVGIKDSSGDFENMTALVERFPGLSVLAGADPLMLPLLRKGGAGCITATSNLVARDLSFIYRNYADPAQERAVDEAQQRVVAERTRVSRFAQIASIKALIAQQTGHRSWSAMRPPLLPLAAKFLHPSIDSLYALPVFLQGMHPLLAGLVTTSLVAPVFVSVSTVALAIASLIMRDFYEPYFRPNPEQELRATRLISLVIAVAPLIFVFFVPEILRLSFFTRALRLSISIVAVIGFSLPLFRSGRGATLGLLAAALFTSVWYALGNPYGIDNMYVAAVTPVLVMVIERALSWPNSATITETRKQGESHERHA